MTGTQISYYFLCKRKLWLFTNSIQMEQTSDTVAVGRHISETSYERRQHEIKIDDVVLDFYDARTHTIHEIKKSDAMEETHIWQVKHYIQILESKGIPNVKGEIDYPKLRQKVQVVLSDNDREELVQISKDIERIVALPSPPLVINKPFCKKCSYYELCYV